MAKLKFGEGIKLEAKIDLPPAQLEYSKPSKSEEALEAIKRTVELNKKLEEMGVSLDTRVSKNEKDILDTMRIVNDLDMSRPEPTRVIQPEVKSITIHKDHKDDLRFLEDQTRIKIKSESAKRVLLSDKLNKELKKQQKLNIVLGIGLALSILLHLI